MKLPDISGMDRQRASFHIQHVLKQEQNMLPEGHGIWYNLYRYPDLKMSYSSMPVRYKVDRLIPVFAPLPEGHRKPQLDLVSRLVKTCIVAVRVTGPIVNSFVYRNALAYKQAKDKEYHDKLEREHRAWQARGGWRQEHPEFNKLDF